ncbi:ATP-dependent DNA ligase [Variovorax phage VAC_51]|uniref:DNA ligase n=1 Tax=Variovorax phage VAC_51 TaxID=2985242 RepID=A0A9N6WU96_9CAUD|nr:ATP-dependent DNA ligase [Variovorax phage VAC_51]
MSKLMKGHTFAKGKKKLTYPCSVEIKIDEIRLDVRNDGQGVIFRSFADKPLHNLERYKEMFSRFMVSFDIPRLDMGVIVNKSFNDTYRYVRSSKGLPADLEVKSLEFILFDLPHAVGVPYIERILWRRKYAGIMRDYDLPVITPERSVASNEEDVLALYAAAVERGFEGLMVKDHAGLYELDKRTNGWLKVKPEEDADGIVQGISEAVSEAGEPLGRVGSLRVEAHLPDGSTQLVNVPGIPHEIGRAWFLDPSLIVGQWIEFQYMMRDRQGGFRHPRFNRIREAKA